MARGGSDQDSEDEDAVSLSLKSRVQELIGVECCSMECLVGKEDELSDLLTSVEAMAITEKKTRILTAIVILQEVDRTPQGMRGAPTGQLHLPFVVCLDRTATSLFESGDHVTRSNPPRSPSLTSAQKVYANQMAQAGMKPARIRTSMLTQFSLRPEDLPPLQKVQNVVCYFRRTKVGDNDSIANITSLARAQAFHGNEEDHEQFTFGWQWNENGQVVVGN
ncbi:unnamed protein product [Phytophthora fragariaefolia]|uniref:Unnamed protein product n=1 Tax=Phytophthora fragariaefolia TaxID=1490495 RepID=A0A9W6XU70_9STRA|nr:unnamed protein product [Phytophthora fragariaefolia]